MSRAINVEQVAEKFIEEQGIVPTEEEKRLIQLAVCKGALEQVEIFRNEGLY